MEKAFTIIQDSGFRGMPYSGKMEKAFAFQDPGFRVMPHSGKKTWSCIGGNAQAVVAPLACSMQAAVPRGPRCLRVGALESYSGDVPWKSYIRRDSMKRAARRQHCAGSPRSQQIQEFPATSLLSIQEVDRARIEGMPYRRNVFTFDDWKKHQSAGRHLRHIQTIASSRIINSLIPPVLIMTGIASAVVSVNTLVLSHVLPEWVPIFHLNPLLFTLTSPGLSFLLVFRTNASYGRFDEARKMWGLMLNRTRDIARQALNYMARDDYAHERPKLLQFMRHLQAFPLAFKHHLLQEGDLEVDLKTYTSLTDEEVQAVVATKHRPNYVLQMCSECLSSSHMDPVFRAFMDQNLTSFADDVGGCERIFKTPIPLSYTRLTSRFLVLYHAFLPLALWDSCNWVTIPATTMVVATFFCIEEVGVLIEQPFAILALGGIAQSARDNVEELLILHTSIRGRIAPDEPAPGTNPDLQKESRSFSVREGNEVPTAAAPLRSGILAK